MNVPRESLDVRLKAWRVNPPADPEFRHRVWQRIGARQRETWPVYLRSHASAWSLVAVFALGAAAYTGGSLARAHVRADREALVTNYLVELDPRVQAVMRPSGS